MSDTDKLKTERVDDPLGRNYSAMTDQQLADSINAKDRTRDRTSMSAGEIMEHIDGTEFSALNNAAKARVDRVLGLGAEIVVGPGNAHNAIQELLATFGSGSNTITALSAAREEIISRAEELNLPFIFPGHVEQTRF